MNAKRKIIISLAPVPGASVSIDPQGLAAEIVEAAQAGAGMVHLHVKGRDGKLTDSLDTFQEVVEAVCARSDIVIQASTGGVSGMNIQQRCAPLSYSRVETASLNPGSVNLGRMVYQNPDDDVKYCVKEIYRHGILPEIECFELGMINRVTELTQELPFRRPVLYNIVLGHPCTTPATVEHLVAMRSFIPKDAMWGITHFGRKNYDILIAAVAMGASLVRIGFEDSVFDGEEPAKDNVTLVRRMAEIIRCMGHEPAAPEEVREILRLHEIRRIP